jgi:hypothetical protein
MGLDATPGYEIGSVKPNMPYLQDMIDSGIRIIESSVVNEAFS